MQPLSNPSVGVHDGEITIVSLEASRWDGGLKPQEQEVKVAFNKVRRGGV